VLVVLVTGAAAVAMYQRWRAEVARQEASRLARLEEEQGIEAGVRAAERERLAGEEQRRTVELATRAGSEQQRSVAELEAEFEGEKRRRKAEELRREKESKKQERRFAEQRARDEQEQRAASARQQEAEPGLMLQREATREAEEQEQEAARAEEKAQRKALEQDDDTPDVDTESTIDDAEERRGWGVDGDLRPIIDYLDLQAHDGSTETVERLGGRVRLGVVWGLTKKLRVGARLAGVCFTDDCDVEFVLQRETPSFNGLTGGQFTFDELFLHWFRRARFDVAVGRLQTRFVLRGGVYAKSLDRNDSNNVNVTWTDGIHGKYRGLHGWSSHFVLQRNAREGSGSIRGALLNFDDSSARNTYFLAFENIRSWGPVTQRAFDVSYLPSSLLKDGDPDGRREDYWGLVGRLAARWPQRSEGLRLRAGAELGYAPVTPTAQAVDLDGSGDVDGMAWNVVVSAMDLAPGHSIGLNYARTGPAWFLSPQFRPNEELIEVRYQWRPQHLPLLEARGRWREGLEQLTRVAQEGQVFDFYLRLTWEFTIKDF